MKPKNFPARKLRRQLRALRGELGFDMSEELAEARRVRTKKDRRKL